MNKITPPKQWLRARPTNSSSWIFLLLLPLMILFSGCFTHYFQTNTVHEVDAKTVENLIKEKKYFILHTSNYAYELADPTLSDGYLNGRLDSLLTIHKDNLHPKKPNANRFPGQAAEDILYEVHLYTALPDPPASPLHIPLGDFTRMDVYELDKKSTSKAEVRSIVGIALTTAGAVGIIIAIVQENNANNNQPPPTSSGNSETITCSPQVYIMNDQEALMEGTLYSGAIYASLERNDYLPLSLANPAPKQIQVMVKGEKNEALMFHDVRLLEISHPADRRVLLDRHGKVLLCGQPVSPFHASIGDGKKNVMHDILAPDAKYYSFTNDVQGAHASDIVLDFRKPKGIASGKLLIRAKNSPWAYYLFRQYKSLYGEYYNTLIRKKDSADANKVLQCELDQYLPLIVSVRKDGQWKFMDYFPTPGNSGPRDLIMELDLSDQKDADQVEVRLQTTYFFWDLDYAAMDFSKNDEYESRTIDASRLFISGPDLKQKEVNFNSESHLSVSDQQRLNLEFQIGQKENTNQQFSYFLVGKGYYHDDTKFPGKPNFAEISKFSGKGAFDQYSRKKLDELVQAMDDGTVKELTEKK